MKNDLLKTQLKRTEWAYLFFMMFGSHYLYLGKPGMQLLYWISIGGFGIWFLVDMFTMDQKIQSHNTKILMQLER